jgi:hypothetical protein
LAELPETTRHSQGLEAVVIASPSIAPKDDGPPIYCPSEPIGTALRQGEIITDLVQVRLDLVSLKSGKLVADQIVHPFAIVLTQDCDCIQDHTARSTSPGNTTRETPNIVFGEIHTAEWMRDGSNPRKIDSDIWRRGVKANKNERYHFFEAVNAEADAEGTGLPELTLDFRRCFSIPTDEVYYRVEIGEAKRRCRLVSPYLEHLGVRYSAFTQRIALPRDHESI